MATKEPDRSPSPHSSEYNIQVTNNINTLRKLIRELGIDADPETLLARYEKETGQPARLIKHPRRRS